MNIYNQKRNFLLGRFATKARTLSKARISSEEIRLLRKFKHSKLDSLKASARICSSSIIIMLLDRSKSFNAWFALIISANSLADSAESLLLLTWHTLIDLLSLSALAKGIPPSSPRRLLLSLISFSDSHLLRDSIKAFPS